MFTVSVLHNITDDELTHEITDEMTDEMTEQAGCLTVHAHQGGRILPGNTLLFVGSLPVPAGDIVEAADFVWLASRLRGPGDLAQGVCRLGGSASARRGCPGHQRAQGGCCLLACDPGGWTELPNVRACTVIPLRMPNPPTGVAAGCGALGRPTEPGLIRRAIRCLTAAVALRP